MKNLTSFLSLLIILLSTFTSLPFSLQAAEKGILRVKTDLDKRVALIIGNSNYSKKVGPLKNPVNDARTMAKVLKKVGFEVIKLENATHREMREALRKFGRKLRESDASLFYFSGHGVQFEGSNYLMPLGTQIEIPRHIKTDAISEYEVLSEMDGGSIGRVNIVIVDACRENLIASNTRSIRKGLGEPITEFRPSGSLIAYATEPFKVAYDGEGSNSPYVEELSKHILTPGLKIEDVLKRVRKGVKKITKDKQKPWYNASLEGDFYFIPVTETAGDANLDYERQKIEEEKIRLKLEQQRLNAQKEAEIEYQRKENERKRLAAEREEAKLREERRRIAAEKRKLAEERNRIRDDSDKKEKIQSYEISDTKFRGLYGSGSSGGTYSNISLYFITGKWGFGVSTFTLETTSSKGFGFEIKNQSFDITYDYLEDISLTSLWDDSTLTLGIGLITSGEMKSSALSSNSTDASGYRFIGYSGKNFGNWEFLFGYNHILYSYGTNESENLSGSGGTMVIGIGVGF